MFQPNQRPTLRTDRLVLRPFTLDNAADIQRLAGDPAIASTTLNVPHPYLDGMAEKWIATHQEKFEQGKLVNFAVTLAATGELIGTIGLGIDERHERAEIGYWIGRPYWGCGYCTEAARAVIAYGFGTLGLNRIFGSCFARNPASGRVLEKAGMTREGCSRRHVRKDARFEDMVNYGILRSDHEGGPG